MKHVGGVTTSRVATSRTLVTAREHQVFQDKVRLNKGLQGISSKGTVVHKPITSVSLTWDRGPVNRNPKPVKTGF